MIFHKAGLTFYVFCNNIKVLIIELDLMVYQMEGIRWLVKRFLLLKTR